jgi:hypothetical protein
MYIYIYKYIYMYIYVYLIDQLHIQACLPYTHMRGGQIVQKSRRIIIITRRHCDVNYSTC